MEADPRQTAVRLEALAPTLRGHSTLATRSSDDAPTHRSVGMTAMSMSMSMCVPVPVPVVIIMRGT